MSTCCVLRGGEAQFKAAHDTGGYVVMLMPSEERVIKCVC